MGREERPKTVRRTRFRLDTEKRWASRATKVADRKKGCVWRLEEKKDRQEKSTTRPSAGGTCCICSIVYYPPSMPLLSVRWPGPTNHPCLLRLGLLHDATQYETGSSNLRMPILITIAASDGRLRHRAYSQVERHVNPVVTHLHCKQAGVRE
jgi:hypothetical protein